MHNITRIQIRGQMGVQLLQTALGIARMPANSEPIVIVNTGGLTNGDPQLDIVDTKFRVTAVPDMGKTPYWVPGAATEIFTNLEKIRRWMTLRSGFKRITFDAAIHMRGGDKETMSRTTAHKWLEKTRELERPYEEGLSSNLRQYGNHPILAMVTRGVYRTPAEDWFDMYQLSRLYAGPSGYIMSMLLFNPNKTIYFADESWHDGPYPFTGNDFVFLREAMKFCPNVTLIPKS